MAGVRARRYCYPHALLGKKVVSKEDFKALPKDLATRMGAKYFCC